MIKAAKLEWSILIFSVIGYVYACDNYNGTHNLPYCEYLMQQDCPAMIETTVETPMKDDVRLTPILAIATFDRKNAKTEQPIPW